MRGFFATRGGRIFGTVWFGQLISNVGSGMTGFGLGIWVYLQTGSATQLALIVLASRLPMLLVSPFAGALVDRWDRRVAMIVSDTGAAAGTVATIALLATGQFEIWHLYLTLSFSGIFEAFQFPAYSAATTLLVPKEQYGRAAGFVQLAGSIARVAAPMLAAFVVVGGGLTALFVIDLVTFLVAVGTLLVVRFPRQERTSGQDGGIKALLAEARLGLTFVTERKGLLILLLSFLAVNFAFSFQSVLLIPLLLTLGSEATAGAVVSLSALGLVAGSLAVSIWGGPRNRIAGVYAPILAMGAGLVLMGLRPTIGIVVVGITLVVTTHPVAAASSQAIWQSKVPPALQGRVFAVRQVTAIAAAPAAFLLAGVLADRIFEPFLAGEGGAAGLIGSLLGTGQGRGIGLLFVLMGLLVGVIVAVAWRSPRIQALETDVPDFEPDAEPVAEPVAA